MHEAYKDIGSPIVCLLEECAELIHILCKVQRFGIDDFHPVTKEINRNRVIEEMADVEYRINQVKELLGEQ